MIHTSLARKRTSGAEIGWRPSPEKYCLLLNPVPLGGGGQKTLRRYPAGVMKIKRSSRTAVTGLEDRQGLLPPGALSRVGTHRPSWVGTPYARSPGPHTSHEQPRDQSQHPLARNDYDEEAATKVIRTPSQASSSARGTL